MNISIHTNHERGAAMMISLIFFIVASVLIVIGMTGPTAREFRTASDAIVSKNGYYAAESAAEDVYYRYKNSLTLGGSDTVYMPIGSATAVIGNFGVGQKEIVSTSSVQNTERKARIVHNDGTTNYDIDSWAETQ